MTIREAIYNMVIGAPGFGKTTWIVKHLKYKSPRKDVLLYKSDIGIDDKAVADFKRIPRGQSYNGGWAKVSNADIKYPEFLTWVRNNFRNGALVVDDAGFFEGHNISPEFEELMMMRRHLGIDIYYVYHGLSKAPIAHFAYVSNMILFHTTDNPKFKANKLPDGGERFFVAHEKIKKMVAAGYKYQPIVINLT